MSGDQRLEVALEAVLSKATTEDCPPALGSAIRYAVFPGGNRTRPKLCLAVAAACGGGESIEALSAGVALELLHCASLVHDDLPCFDDADRRRGAPSVHRKFGVPVAILAGDALIVLAFESLAESLAHRQKSLVALLSIVARAVGARGGIVAGQGWEVEPNVRRDVYHRAKTASMFVAATMAGAAAAGCDPSRWRTLGEKLGEAYQVADDIADVAGHSETMGKPVRRDAELGRPSAVRDLGHAGARSHLDELVRSAIASIPHCRGASDLKALVEAQALRMVPSRSALVAA